MILLNDLNYVERWCIFGWTKPKNFIQHRWPLELLNMVYYIGRESYMHAANKPRSIVEFGLMATD